jgi:predicted phosphodiesterase
MKVAVLADIHGNLPALDAVLEKIEDDSITDLIL